MREEKGRKHEVADRVASPCKKGNIERPSSDKELRRLRKKVREKKRELAECNEKYLRFAAEFDNYRKRTDKEFIRIIEYAGESVLREILPLMDDIERAIDNKGEDQTESSIREGVELIYKKFVKILKDLGVEPMDSLGKPFDPDFHHAMMARKEKKSAPNTIVETFEKGYKYKKHVLRHAKVVVSK